MRLLITGGHVVDSANHLDGIYDILLENGKIRKIAKKISCTAEKRINAQNKIVMPGLIDMHVHLREPGREDKETVATATAAALKGGVTSMLAMPNTTPAIDSVKHAALLEEIIKKNAEANVLIAGCITKGRKGKELTDITKLKNQGVKALTDDGSSVDDEVLFLRALKKAKENGVLVICHCEDKALSKGGVVNEGIISTRMGLRGISKESEYSRIRRDIKLTEKAKARVHIAHISCKESVEIIARAKKRGVSVTCETAPHYFTLTEEDVLGFNTNMKVNPPLRSREDVEAIRQGLKDGTIDVIASDHAPHTENEKDIEFERAEFGMLGLETILAVSITQLIHSGILDWPALVGKLAAGPARTLGVNRGTLAVGACADIIVVDPQREWALKKEDILSKSKNSPFIGRKLKGQVEYTIYQGKIAYSLRS